MPQNLRAWTLSVEFPIWRTSSTALVDRSYTLEYYPEYSGGKGAAGTSPELDRQMGYRVRHTRSASDHLAARRFNDHHLVAFSHESDDVNLQRQQVGIARTARPRHDRTESAAYAGLDCLRSASRFRLRFSSWSSPSFTGTDRNWRPGMPQLTRQLFEPPVRDDDAELSVWQFSRLSKCFFAPM